VPLLFRNRAAAYLLIFIPWVLCGAALAQDNYEIQVYGADTVAPKTTMLELHSNFTADGSKPLPGSKYAVDGLYPTNHAEHETVEITQGITSWSEVGFYIFTSARDGNGWQWVGDHIRPRVRVPDSWHWPLGVSLSTEIGYQRRQFSTDTWTWEIRPIVDKTLGRWYFAVNPALERSFHGQTVNQGIGFSPNAKISYDFNKYISGGLEYYADYGCFAELGDQLRRRRGTNLRNRSPHREGNRGPALRLDAPPRRQLGEHTVKADEPQGIHCEIRGCRRL
jgi:hypothetical protein